MENTSTEREINPEYGDFVGEKIPAPHSRNPEEMGNLDGFIYHFYFETQEHAERAVRDFWNNREGSMMTQRGIKSGMLQPLRHEITGGDRTSPQTSNKHPEKPFMIIFNGNTIALSEKGEESLRKIGLIE